MSFSQILGPVILLTLVNCYSSAELSNVAQSATVNFPGLGTVSVKALEPEGHLPQILITERPAGRQLLLTDVGTSDPEGRHSYVIHHDWRASCPRVRFRVQNVTGMPSPLILAIAIRPGGSDCRYAATIIGAVDGQLKVLTPDQLWSNAEGGFYVGDLGRRRGYGLVRWNFVWGDEAHYQPHRYEVSIFRFDAAESRFKLVQKTTSHRKYHTGEEWLAEMGLNCRNVLRNFPDLGC
jgi:hypothetical protein